MFLQWFIHWFSESTILRNPTTNSFISITPSIISSAIQITKRNVLVMDPRVQGLIKMLDFRMIQTHSSLTQGKQSFSTFILLFIDPLIAIKSIFIVFYKSQEHPWLWPRCLSRLLWHELNFFLNRLDLFQQWPSLREQLTSLLHTCPIPTTFHLRMHAPLSEEPSRRTVHGNMNVLWLGSLIRSPLATGN